MGKIALGLRADYLAIATLLIAEIVVSVIKHEDWLARGVKNVIGLKRPVPYEVDKVKNFFNQLGTTVEIKKENSSLNFWSTSGMMAPFYQLLSVMTAWLVKNGVKRNDAQKYITSLFLALSED